MWNDPLIQYYISAVIMLVPVIRILERAGFRPYWALLLGVPMIGYILCAAVLCRKWKTA